MYKENPFQRFTAKRDFDLFELTPQKDYESGLNVARFPVLCAESVAAFITAEDCVMGLPLPLSHFTWPSVKA